MPFATDWLNVFINDLDMKNKSVRMAPFDGRIILNAQPSMVKCKEAQYTENFSLNL